MAEIFDDGWSDTKPKLTTNINKLYVTKSDEPIGAHILVPQPIGRLEHDPTCRKIDFDSLSDSQLEQILK